MMDINALLKQLWCFFKNKHKVSKNRYAIILVSSLLILLIFLCSCSLKTDNIDIRNSSDEEMIASNPESDYSDLHKFAKMYEKFALGRNLCTDIPVFFTMGVLDQYNKDEDYNKDYFFTMPYEETKEIASLFFCKELIAENNESFYGWDLEEHKDVVLEPFEINDNGEETSVLYGRFIDDEDGIRHWLYPVTYTVVPYILTDDEIPLIFSDELKVGEKRYRIKNIENITNLEDAKKIYTDNGYSDLFIQKKYEISSSDDIIEMAKRVNSEIFNEMNADDTLTKDVDMCNVEFTPIGTSKYFIGYLDERNPNNIGFCGTFDGNNYTISNLNYVEETAYVDCMSEAFGFFSVLGSGAHVSNLNIENANIGYKGDGNNVASGILAGRMLNSTVENCSVSGVVKGVSDVGGLVGDTSVDCKVDDSYVRGEIYDCKGDVEVFGENWIGGLIGSNHFTIVSHCSVKGTVTCNKINDDTNMPIGIGGFAGHNFSAEIRNCGASVWVKTMVNSSCVGSHVGLNEGDVYECFYNSSVSNWKPSGDSPREKFQNDVVGLSNVEYNKRLDLLTIKE